MSSPLGEMLPAQAAQTGAGRAWLIALLGWTALLCFYDLRGGARFEPIDCWVAQTAREMLDADEWLVPRFSGETRMQKSPGPYWTVMVVSLLRGTGVDEISARMPNALAAVALVGIIFWLTRRIAGERAALFAGFAASGSVLILWWSHRGASDLGLTLFTTLALAAAWIAVETEPRGPRRGGLLLVAWLAAGLGMIYKMPMPLVVVGLPVACYVVVRNRWRVLLDRWHLGGLALFLLPWVPWALAVCLLEPAAFWKWKVEFLDRFTGELPNVKGQREWPFLFTYLGPPLLYCLPFSLSLPGALVRAFRRQPGVNRDGTLFMFIWFASLLVFFTASAGKEWRYFLPALPPLFVLLGIELAAFFDPARRTRPGLERAVALAIWIGVPGGLAVGIAVGLRKWWLRRGQYELAGLYEWTDVWLAVAVVAVLIAVGCGLSAWWYVRRKEGRAFGVLVVMMWAVWLYAWPNVLPKIMSQRPFIDFAGQLANPQLVPPGWRHNIRHIGSQDSRITWYSDVRVPRLIDQLELLQAQEGARDLEWETEQYGRAMIEHLSGDEPILLLATLPDYLMFVNAAPPRLAAEGRPLPPLHLWLQTRYGTEDRHFVLFGNKPPRHAALELRLRPEVAAQMAAKGRQTAWPTTWPASQPADELATGPAEEP